ncbi:MAG: PDZ domain-containing protein [Pirellulaceae bacterium]
MNASIGTPWMGLLATPLLALALLTSGGASANGQDEQRFRDRDDRDALRSARVTPQFNPRPGPIDRHRLGVTVRNLETGARITSVARGSAAERAGLEVGDTIVTVAGYQVGYVAGRLYELPDEIARRLDRRGNVLLLVQNRRNERLTNVPVSLRSGGDNDNNNDEDYSDRGERVEIRGVINAPGNGRLTSESIQVVRVLDTSRPDWRRQVVARSVEHNPGQLPLNFDITFQAKRNHNYAIEAIIYDRGRQYVTDPERVAEWTERTVRVELMVRREEPWVEADEWYRSHLGRRPTQREEAAWRKQLENGATPAEIEGQLLGGDAF